MTWREAIPRTVWGDSSTTDNSIGLTVQQNLFTGFRVTNAIRQSEAGVLASREFLRNTVQNVLFDAAQVYSDVIRDIAILESAGKTSSSSTSRCVRRTSASTSARTRAPMWRRRAPLQRRRDGGRLAVANLAISRAIYRQVIGHDTNGMIGGFPYGTAPARQPTPRESGLALDEHPIIHAAIHQADAQAFVVKQVEGELLPVVSLPGDGCAGGQF